MQTGAERPTSSPLGASTTVDDAGQGSASGVGNAGGATEQPRQDNPVTLRLRTGAQRTRENIVDLTHSIRTIRTNFDSVSDVLLKIDREQFTTRTGRVLRLRPAWREHADRFEDIIKRSCETAVDASSMIKQYIPILPQLTGADPAKLKDLKAKIHYFLNKLERKVRDADEMERDLRKLVYDIRSFGKGDLGNAHDLVHKLLDEELQSIQNKMQTLDSRLESVSAQMKKGKRRWWVVGGVGILALVTLGLPAPAALAITPGIVGIGCYAGYVQCTQYNNLVKQESEIATKKVETSLRQSQVTDHMEGCKDDLRKTQQDVTSVADKIATIGTIWRYLQMDMRTLVEDIDNAVGPTTDAEADLSYMPYLEISREVYKRLSEYLDLYAKADICFDDD